LSHLVNSLIDASKIIALSHVKVGSFNFKQDINHDKNIITTKVIMTERPKEEVEAIMNLKPESELMEQFWSISRAEYLTVPRSIIQLMPVEWQNKLARLMEEMDNTVDWHPEGEESYWVELGTRYFEDENDGEGQILSVPDPLQEYRHGNRYAEGLFKKKELELLMEQKAVGMRLKKKFSKEEKKLAFKNKKESQSQE